MQPVVDDVYADLKQLIGVTPHERQICGERSMQVNFVSLQSSLGKLNGGLCERIYVEKSLLARDLPSKVEQAGHQRLGAPYMVSDFFSEFALIIGQHRRAQQIRVAEHRSEGIVDLVGSASH